MILAARLSADDVANIDDLLDAQANAEMTAVVLAPNLRTPDDVCELLATMTSSERWKANRISWGRHAQADTELVEVTWQTAESKKSGVMGFAPIGSMPVMRRSPYVGLALWPGGNSNQFRKSRPGTVGFIDAKHDFDKQGHDKLWNSTEAAVRTLADTPSEDIERWRRAAFALPSKLLDRAGI